MTLFRFAGFELDEERAELRGPDGAPTRLRPKTFEMLRLFAANPGRVLSKQELMEAVWPNIHVGEDGLFQCIREIRAALGDEQRQMIKLVSGRGYLFAGEVSDAEPGPKQPTDADAPPAPAPRPFGRRAALAAGVGLAAIVGIAAFAIVDPALRPSPPIVAVLPIVERSADPSGAGMAADVTEHLVDGLARIDNLRVVAPGAGAASSSQFEVQGELQKVAGSWTLRLRTLRTATGEVESVVTASVDGGIDAQLRPVRLAAGVGDPLARRLNELIEGSVASAGSARVVIEQASASLNQTSRERFAAAETMLQGALAADPDSVELQTALVALQTRGIQMVWYGTDEAAAAESSGRSLLQQAVGQRPRSIPVLEAQCRFLTATNDFVESLVACAKAVSFDPWNGSALYQIGLAQLFLGRFEDALATFTEADRFDTPAVSRWTWTLGAGWASLLLGRNDDAVDWVQRSIAITPGSGRSHLALAVAFHRLGRLSDSRAAFAKALELRPGSTAANVMPPSRNVSPAFLEANGLVIQTLIELGLPES